MTSVDFPLPHLLHIIGPALIAVLITACDVSDRKTQGFQASDPVVVDYPIAYVERPLPLGDNANLEKREILDPAAFHPGARLVIKERASASAIELVITDDVFPRNPDDSPALYDVKDLAPSPDGRKLLFAMRAPEIPNAEEDPTWNIWEYDLDNDILRQVISDTIYGDGTPYQPDLYAEEGHDVAPQYLPDGRIIFSSNRQERGRAILLDENKPQYHGLDDKRQEESYALHVMDADGRNRQQITFNASQDLQPAVLDDGDIVFLRRDGIGNHDRLSLYRVKPDGSDVQLYYGYHTQNTGTNDSEGVFARPLELEDGRLLVNLVPRTTARWGGDVVGIDAINYIAADQPTYANAGASGPGQISLINLPVDTEGVLPSIGGYFNSAYPLYDGTERLLVSWSQCRLVDPETALLAPCTEALINAGAEQLPPAYGLWMYDPREGTQLPVKLPQDGLLYTDAVVLAPRPIPTAWRPQEVDPAETVGVLHIRSIYDFGSDADGQVIAAQADPLRTAPDSRQRRFLRIVKNVPIPDDDDRDFDPSAYGVSRAQGMRDILGYVPIEPDGSAKFKVPADMPFMLDIVDVRGKRIGGRHQNWLHLRPGEERECTGCHTPQSELPHGRRDAEADSANPGAMGGAPFANTLLRDEFGTPQANPEFGESMAEYYARIYGPRTPAMDIVFTDEWTNPARLAPGADLSLRYVDIEILINANPRDPNCPPLDPTPPTWVPPTSCTTADSWESRCRITLHYEQHIHPLWEADRRSCDEMGNVVADQTCTSCHSGRDQDGMAMLPAGQLELTGEASADRNAFLTSYAELMFQDNALELVEGSLTDLLIERPTGEYETDEDGNLVLDENDEPIPIIDLVNVTVPASMSISGARSSNRFFQRFEQASANDTVQHVGLLSPAELKLIAEWLDIGGQYYNDPFVAPQD